MTKTRCQSTGASSRFQQIWSVPVLFPIGMRIAGIVILEFINISFLLLFLLVALLPLPPLPLLIFLLSQ